MRETPESGPLVLVVEDDSGIYRLVTLILSGSDLRVQHEDDLAAALAAVESCQPDVVLLDLSLGGSQGLSEIKRLTTAPVIMLTATDSGQTLVECLQAGAHDVLLKPFDPEDLEATVRFALGDFERLGKETDPRNWPGLLKQDGYTPLSLTEWRFIQLLNSQHGEPMLYQELNTHLWGRQLRQQQDFLRAWAERVGSKVRLTEFHGVGYALAGAD